jgi:hypothetical protein
VALLTTATQWFTRELYRARKHLEHVKLSRSVAGLPADRAHVVHDVLQDNYDFTITWLYSAQDIFYHNLHVGKVLYHIRVAHVEARSSTTC